MGREGEKGGREGGTAGETGGGKEAVPWRGGPPLEVPPPTRGALRRGQGRSAYTWARAHARARAHTRARAYTRARTFTCAHIYTCAHMSTGARPRAGARAPAQASARARTHLRQGRAVTWDRHSLRTWRRRWADRQRQDPPPCAGTAILPRPAPRRPRRDSEAPCLSVPSPPSPLPNLCTRGGSARRDSDSQKGDPERDSDALQ